MPIKNIKKGAILVARPSLNIDIFSRSVVLITEHSEFGSVGFVLNKSSEISLNNLMDKTAYNFNLFNGGPLDKQSLFYLHKRPDIINNSIYIMDNLYWGGDFTTLQECIQNNSIKPEEINFYLGYCGWGKDQLKNELESKEWDLINDYSFDLFSKLDQNLWRILMKKKGGENLIWLNTPFDPSMN